MELNDGLRRVLLDASHARSAQARLRAFAGIRPGQIVPLTPRNSEPRTGLSMGEHQAITTAEWGIGRTEQDELAAASHHNLAAAYDRGLFDDLLTPFLGLIRDQNLRPDTSVDKLAALRPVFGTSLPEPSMTAGNSTPLSDGASTVLLASDDWAAERDLPVLAYLADAETAAVDYVHGDRKADGLLMAPVYAVPRLLARNGLGLADFDFFEIHEAFAATVLTTLKAWQDEQFCRDRLGLDGALGTVDRTKLNVAGSSLAAGHPFAATGGRILATTAKLLCERSSQSAGSDRPARGLISICAAGGQGVVAIVEAA
jgi:acetyl-CoA C-acetyltransferase